MKILLSGPRFHANYNGMIQGLEDAGHEVHFLSLFDDFKYTKVSKTKYHHNKHYIKFPSSLNFGFFKKRLPPNWQYLPNPFALIRLIKKIEPDLIIARDFSFQTITLKFLSGNKIKFLLYNLWDIDLEYRKLSLFNKILIKLIFNKQNRITPIFKNSNPRVLQSKGKTHSFYFPVISVPSGEKKQGKTIKFLCVSKLDQKRKNIKMLVAALRPYLQKDEATLHIIGTVKDELSPTYKNLIETVKSTKGISLEENLPYKECLNRYKNFDFFVLPAESEPLGYSILEAWSAGLPVLIADDGGLSKQIMEGETGFLFESNNQRSLQQKLEYILTQRRLIPEMGNKALEISKQFYQPRAFEKRIMEIYDKIN